MADASQLARYSDELYHALTTRTTVAPLSERDPALTIDDAYQISLGLLARREAAGERVVGKKIGLTSRAVQDMLKVGQPDFGFLTDRMRVAPGTPVPIGRELIAPRAEGEIAFILKEDLMGPGVTNADVLRATAGVAACFEIVDSRVQDWKIKIQDTVADNASCGLFVVSDELIDPRSVDLVTCGMVMWKNGEVAATGAGAAALGSPVNCVTWLANTLGVYGVGLKAGDVILSGSLVPLLPIVPGDRVELAIGGIGRLAADFV
jgi:2-oxopent-4-enoate/cis-2-oxohex-4-enoate hydratase